MTDHAPDSADAEQLAAAPPAQPVPPIGLTTSIDALTSEARELRRDLRARTRALWAAVVALALIIVVGVPAVAIVTLNNQDEIRDNNQRWCPTLSLLLPQPGDKVPNNERTRLVIQRTTDLAVSFGCDVPGR